MSLAEVYRANEVFCAWESGQARPARRQQAPNPTDAANPGAAFSRSLHPPNSQPGAGVTNTH